MTIDEILELMDELLDKAVAVPFSKNKCLVEVEKLREYFDEIRYNLPTEIKNAKGMVSDRAKILSDAKEDAEKIIKRAEERAKLLVSNNEVLKQAKEKADEMLLNAQKREKDIRIAMNEKMEEMLSQTEEILTKNINDIKNTRAAIRSTAKVK